jgi:hypothetical protein
VCQYDLITDRNDKQTWPPAEAAEAGEDLEKGGFEVDAKLYADDLAVIESALLSILNAPNVIMKGIEAVRSNPTVE